MCSASPPSAAVLGAGPVGRAIVDRLSDRGAGPLLLTRSGTQLAGATSATVDAYDARALAAALSDAGAEVLFHSAQPPYHRWAEEFPRLQTAIVDACEEAGVRLVVVENLYGYGPPPGRPLTESMPMRPTTSKGRVRAELWHQLKKAAEDGRIDVAAVRASDFFGPGVELAAFGTRFFGAIAKGKRASVLGDPDTRHSVTYVGDLAEAMVRVAGDRSAFGRAWHAPTAPAMTQRAMVELAASIAGTEARLVPVGPTMLRLAGLFDRNARETIEMLYEFTDDFLLDSSAFEDHFGQKPTPLADSFAATLQSTDR